MQGLLETVQAVLDDLYPSKSKMLVLNLDSSLDTDLGLDSLARVELISRLERRFNVVLRQRVFTDTETPRDLLRAVMSARGREESRTPLEVVELATAGVKNLPRQASTLIEVLEWHVKQHPERLHVRILGDEGEQDALTYAQLWHGAEQLAAGLQQRGVQVGDTVAIMLPTGRDYFFSFYAILLGGAIPVPIYPPLRRSQLEDHLRRHSGILNNCQASTLITMPEAKVVAQLLKSQVETLRNVVTVADLASRSEGYNRPVMGPFDIAFLQYTSGSTGNPKGVVLTHANLLANIRAMGEAVEADANDVFVSWLPLYHDMGLIGAWLGSLYFSVLLVVMSPLSFLTRPQRWLWAIHQYRATLSASPNFGYELCLKRLTDEDLKGLDLSCWRSAFNGAESVSPETIEGFSRRLKAAGFRAESMMPVYGLAESAVGLAFPPLNRMPRIDCVQREKFTSTGKAVATGPSDRNALCFATSGYPLQGHQVRIVDDNNRELPEREQGYLQFRGPSATSGYYRNPQATKNLFKQGWLDSGDLAYIAEGEIFITGRSKDVVIRAGRNIYPHEVEEAVGNIDGIRKGCVVAFGTLDSHTGSERLVIMAETRETDVGVRETLQKKILTLTSDLIGSPPDEVVLVPSHTVLKTSSGKIRRSACREIYEQGAIGRGSKAIWLQFARVALRSLSPVWRRLKAQLLNSLFAAYAWLSFSFLAGLTWLSIMGLPRLSWRWIAMRLFGRTLAFTTGTRITVNGSQNLPAANEACVYVANHSSYLDSYALVAAVPRAFSFVAKAELRERLLIRVALERTGVEFVERFDRQKGLLDSQRIVAAAQRQQSLFFFPEGTFSRTPGLSKFHMGAFMTATRAKIPVIPIAIRGTRSMLRAGSWFPHRGNISINIGEAIVPKALNGNNEEIWQAAIELKGAARRHILRYCGEPDLS